MDAEVEMGMEQEQEALQEYQLVHSTLHRFNVEIHFLGFRRLPKIRFVQDINANDFNNRFSVFVLVFFLLLKKTN